MSISFLLCRMTGACPIGQIESDGILNPCQNPLLNNYHTGEVTTRSHKYQQTGNDLGLKGSPVSFYT